MLSKGNMISFTFLHLNIHLKLPNFKISNFFFSIFDSHLVYRITSSQRFHALSEGKALRGLWSITQNVSLCENAERGVATRIFPSNSLDHRYIFFEDDPSRCYEREERERGGSLRLPSTWDIRRTGAQVYPFSLAVYANLHSFNRGHRDIILRS